PQCQRVGLGGGITVFKSEHRLFRQARIEHLEARLLLAEMIERGVAFLGVLIEQHRVALRKGAAFAVLARQADRMPFLQQGTESERLGGSPVDPLAGLDRLGAVVEETLHRLVDAETRRNDSDLLADLAQGLSRNAGIAT